MPIQNEQGDRPPQGEQITRRGDPSSSHDSKYVHTHSIWTQLHLLLRSFREAAAKHERNLQAARDAKARRAAMAAAARRVPRSDPSPALGLRWLSGNTTPLTVGAAMNGAISSRLWCSSPPLTKQFLEKSCKMRLLTLSKDQGWCR